MEEQIFTPFFQEKTEQPIDKCTEYLGLTYDPYNLFALRTRLEPWFNEEWGKEIEVFFDSKLIENKYFFTVNLYDGGESLVFSPEERKSIQDKVSEILNDPVRIRTLLLKSNVSILSDDENDGHLIPQSWLKTILPHISITARWNPHVNEDGIFIELNETKEYHKIYAKLQEKVIQTIREAYKDGYVRFPSEKIIEYWDLVPVDNFDELYHPTWTDRRITDPWMGPVGFLTSRMEGDQNIDIWIGSNSVVRHFIAIEMEKHNIDIIFVGPYIRFTALNFNTAQYLTTTILNTKRKATGKVLTLAASRKSWIYIYIQIAKDKGYPNCIGYHTVDINEPYIFSCLVENSIDLFEIGRNFHLEALQLIEEYRPKLLEIMGSFPSVLEGKQPDEVTVHDALELELLP